MSAEVPKDDGYYWAMWLVSDEDTEKFYDATPCRIWETVELFTDGEGRRRVYLLGVPGDQAAENFYWHSDRITEPPMKYPKYGTAAEQEKRRQSRKRKKEN